MFARTRLVVGLSALASSTSAFIIPSQARHGVFGKLGEQGYIRNHLISPVILAVTKPDKGTVQDETISALESLLFYDDVLDDSIPEGVVCARGVCVLEDFPDDDVVDDGTSKSILDRVLGSYLGPRLILAGASILYGTNSLDKLLYQILSPRSDFYALPEFHRN